MLTENQNRSLSVFLVFYTIIILYRLFDSGDDEGGYSLNHYAITEWLINYQGGFVRRGIIGEILFQLQNILGLNPYRAIIGIALVLQFTVIVIFLQQFIKRGYPLLLLPLTIFLGNPIITQFWLRKDNLVILILLGAFYILSSVRNRVVKYSLLNLLLILGVLIHEVIVFVGLPILLLLIVQDVSNGLNNNVNSFLKSLVKACVLISPILIMFVIVSLYHGDDIIVGAIIQSWNVDIFPYKVEHWGAVSGISWTKTYNLYVTRSFYLMKGRDVLPIINVGVISFVIYYILLNLDKLNFKFFEYMPRVPNMKVVARVLFFQTVFVLLPLLCLGCDTSRWIYYWVCSTFAVLCIVPSETIEKSLPRVLTKFADKINTKITLWFGSSRGLVLFLALATGFPIMFGMPEHLSDYVRNSPLYLILETISLLPQFFFSQF